MYVCTGTVNPPRNIVLSRPHPYGVEIYYYHLEMQFNKRSRDRAIHHAKKLPHCSLIFACKLVKSKYYFRLT